MTSYIETLLQRFIVKKEHRRYRRNTSDPYEQAKYYEMEQLPDVKRAVLRLKYVLEKEEPVVYPDEKIALLRTVTTIPEIYTPQEYEELRKHHYIHEQGKVCNINPEYQLILKDGLREKRQEMQLRFKDADDKLEEDYIAALIQSLDCMIRFADRYRLEAERVGNTSVAKAFTRIISDKPETLQEALQLLRLLHYCLWCSFNYHNTFGRFDQYIYPFYQSDLANGNLTKEEALELIEEFFICCNKDSDLYPGMQQGDNGQSIVLGGLNKDGSDSFNEFSELCLKASLELKLIDPKINLRVNKNTPLSMYEKGTYLTRQGLGFPQYSNDNIVIPALLRWGYDEADAYNYVVAACWEFIIPGYGMDIPNINGLSFSDAVLAALEKIKNCNIFDEFMSQVKESIFVQAKELMEKSGEVYMEPAPLMSLMMRDCVARAKDISEGNKYNNYGFHGTGLSTAADSLAAIRKYIYDEKRFNTELLLQMLEADFKGYESIQNMLRYEAPKMGNDDDSVDQIAVSLLNWFADALENKHNDRGGIFRAGTGSAMYYIWHAKVAYATPDGRCEGEPLACNYSPSLYCRCNGPISIIKSFSKPNLVRVANGGPLTIELHDTVFRNDNSIQKVAMFVKSFMDMGGHQMQINTVNRERMLDAKKNPENYRNLIVRVWGWSGYFIELDEVYQNHIIERMELIV